MNQESESKRRVIFTVIHTLRYTDLGRLYQLKKKILFIIKSIKRELKTRTIYDCRYDERLEPTYDEFTCLAYTGLLEELEYLNIETRLIDEKFASVMGECVM